MPYGMPSAEAIVVAQAGERDQQQHVAVAPVQLGQGGGELGPQALGADPDGHRVLVPGGVHVGAAAAEGAQGAGLEAAVLADEVVAMPYSQARTPALDGS